MGAFAETLGTSEHHASALLACTLGTRLLSRIVPEPIAGYLSQCVDASGHAEPLVLLVAAVLGLSFFIATLVKRNPQVQYLAEVVVALGLIATWRTY